VRRVLVSGAGGFLGRAVVAALEERGAQVAAAGHDAPFGVDFRLADAVEELFAEVRPDAVVHLAGTSRASDHGRGPEDVRTENVVHPLLNTLEHCAGRRVVMVSSAAVYGAGATDEGAALRPNGLWAAAKASAEVLGRRRAAALRATFIVARPFFLLGPGAARRSEIGGWIAAGGKADQIDVSGSDVLRNLLDVRDAAAGICELVLLGVDGLAYNLAAETSMATSSLLHLLAPLARVGFDGRVREALHGSAPALRALGWAPRVPVEVTLRDTLAAAGPR